MNLDFLLPNPKELRIQSIEKRDQSIEITVLSVADQAACPDCQQHSSQVHSRYNRSPADLSLGGCQTRIFLTVRRFFCKNKYCKRSIFTERLPALVAPYARRTNRLMEVQQYIGFIAGGEAGARITKRSYIPTSPDTLLRLVRSSPEPARVNFKAIGIDDWAMRKGKTYGTIIVDLNTRRPIELLPERSATGVTAWLEKHPEIEVISRDRSNEYIKAATDGASQAIQVADRWHLMKNLREAVEQFLEQNQRYLRAAANKTSDLAVAPENNPPNTSEQPPSKTEELAPPTLRISATQTKLEQQRQQVRQKRFARFQAVMDLYRQGVGMREVARRLGLGRDTVRRYVRAGEFPEMAQRQTKTPEKLLPYLAYLEQRWQEGCQNRYQLWREIRDQGFTGHVQLVYTWSKKRGYVKVSRSKIRNGRKVARPEPTALPPWSARRAVWLVMKAEDELSREEQQALQRMKQVDEQLEIVLKIVNQFRAIFRTKQKQALAQWLQQVEKINIGPLVRFAEGLRDDLPAVESAVELPWSNGVTEGHVNRLKMLKRQMYGRAKFDLLRKRVLSH